MTGAQAADLPVKAKPVQYVKICSLYGAGFYYIPGTDTCIKVGGFVRAEWMHNAGGSFTPSITGSTGSTYTRNFNDTQNRARAAITLDVRSQTEYGTLRSYTQMGWNVTNGDSGSLYTNRAFIQLAGFTAGLSSSFFDDFGFAAYSNQTNWIGSDVGGGGINMVGYTAQLGNGLSASVAIEDANVRRRTIAAPATGFALNTTTGAITANTAYSNQYGGAHLPDFTGNLRVDQAWGSAQIMGAIHEVYPNQLTAGSHNSTKYGFAVGGSVKFNLPMLGKGDNIAAQAVYGKGATGYNIRAAALGTTKGGVTVSTSVDDAVCASTATGCELTESWSVVAGYNHGWNAKWKSSIYGGYAEANYGTTAEGYVGAAAGGLDYSFWQIGSRTVWTPVANLDLSVDVMYNSLDGAAALNTGSIARRTDVWAGIVRAQRNFWP
jgi:hypothetical protein